ncbi:MAG TPA: CAP family protein [Nostocaceae cyanobacterium]|nr:CAP family protein [Nostocaceae cyanobacterium]
MNNTVKKATSTVATGLAFGLASFFVTPSAVMAQNSMAAEILKAHNNYRKQVGVPPLKWSNKLANNAQSWAKYLASLGGRKLVHSKGTNEGENLWLGTSKAFSYTNMVDSWGSEKKYFKNGIFPNVSTTGNWFDVGHYTQIIWRNTTEVGCGVASAGGNDILVCRYSPPGNYQRQRVY